MGQQSKAIQARLKNLQKHVTTPQKAYVEDVTDEEDADYNHAKQHGTADLLEEGFFFLDEDSDSDEDSEYGEEDIDEEELAELKTEDNIHHFNAILIMDFHQICQQIGPFYQRILTGSVRPRGRVGK